MLKDVQIPLQIEQHKFVGDDPKIKGETIDKVCKRPNVFIRTKSFNFLNIFQTCMLKQMDVFQYSCLVLDLLTRL